MNGGVMKAYLVRIAVVFLVAWRAWSSPLVVPDLPLPPEQGTAWTAPRPVSSNLLAAAEALFQQGFPDPRGCEYREVSLTVSGVWTPQAQAVSTHGWVLPAGSDPAQRYAICWNGLIYPVTEVGAPADLHADTMALVPPNARRFNQGLGEIRSVFPTNSPSSRVLLLLRCGEVEAAVKNWVPSEQFMNQAQLERRRPESEVAQLETYDPYLELAEDWAWAQFDCILCAHMRGDVALALTGARKLAEVQPKIESEAERRGFRHPGYSDSLKHEKPRPYLYFLDQLPQLLTDLERRAREPKTASIIDTGRTNIPDASKRIAALIADLDMVQARQWGQPGMVIPEEDPIVHALIQEGDKAVEPLLDCLESDKRLTRSVGFSRDFQRNRVVISVASAARAALQQLLQVQFRSAPEFRAYWRANKGTKLEDRWYATLKDDSASIGEWLQAARNIVQPDSIIGVAGSGHYMEKPVEPGQKPKMRGEVLRSKQNPSVSELLVKRAEGSAAQASKLDQFMGVEALRNGCEFVALLSAWDPTASAVPAARSMMSRAIQLFADPNSFIMSSGHDLARYIPRLTLARVSGGDTNAVAEYAAWIRSAEAQKLDTYVLEAFEPLWRYPKEPALAPVGDWLFNDPASPWSSLPWKRAGFHDPVESELVKVPGFRKLVVRELDNHELVGTLQWQPPNSVSYELKGYGRGSRGGLWPEGERPADGASVEARRCDWIMWVLSNAKRVPFFNPFASVENRDQAIQKAKALLAQPE
jgi:hypothetical protein